MSRSWILGSMFIVGSLVGGASGQEFAGGEKTLPPVGTKKETKPPQGALQPPVVQEPISQPRREPELDTGLQTSFYGGSIAAAGTGVSAAAQGAGAGTTTVGFPQFPVLLPGMLTAMNPEAARPLDRVFFSYGRVDRMQFNQTQLNTGLPLGTGNRTSGLNLNIYTLGLEKTFLDGRASAYIRAPILDATGNSTGQNISGFGDLSVGAKFIIWEDCRRRNLLTSGFTVTVPTGQDVNFPTSFQNVAFPGGNVVATTGGTTFETQRINPTYLQPWVAAQLAGERFFIHEYFGVVVPTQNEVATFLNNNVTVGFLVFENPNGMLRFATATFDFQALIPVTRRGEPASIPESLTDSSGVFFNNTTLPPPSFGFSDQFFITGGGQFGIGQRSIISFGITTPVSGPRAYELSYNIGVSYLY